METVENGPFTLLRKRVTETRYDMNYGRRKSVYSKYEVLYKGQAVTFPAALQVNTGYASIWKAFTLSEAPQPAIIAGSQSMYLITEEGGAAKVFPLSEQNSSYASVQWLDAENGQPGLKQEIYITEDTSATLALSGGEYLLVNRSTVLHVPDLKVYSFRQSVDLTDNYYSNDVVAFSPDRQEIVFSGSKQSPEQYDKFIYALLVYNFKTNEAYAVPFDQTETRLHRPEYITSDWLNTYFEWDHSSGDKAVLKKQQLSPLPYWQGLYTKTFSYELNPVKAEMQPVLLEFVKTIFALEDSDIEQRSYGDYKPYLVNIEGHQFELWYMEDLNSISFSPNFQEKDTKEIRRIIKKLGDAFNEELRQGKYQDLFTSY
ncbi:MAG: hypothetical protein R2824_26435 [Saprospiraceae bacterium]